MTQYSTDAIRKSYLEFFKSKSHLAAHSFPLIPQNDNTLLLINAGMAPLKRYFTGADTPPATRMVTCQKCVRTGDIDNVGITSRHCTFFEMLGNFSFGDYFKREAIEWAWEYLTKTLEINPEKLWISVFHEDDEAYNIWVDEIKVPTQRMVRLGKEDNFWELEVGPSGPCSEIYYDRGEQYSCDEPDCKPGCDCDRYVEIWNLVFTQFDKDEKGIYHPLANPNIDTGMGLERVAAVLQGKNNVFEVEPFISLIRKTEVTSGKKYEADKKSDISFRIIADHTRAMTFLIGDGVIPSNEGRGYVLRRLIRRAARHGKLLGIQDHFLHQLSQDVVLGWGEAYPELKANQEQIKQVIEIEETKFNRTIDQGMSILEQYCQEMDKQKEETLSGEKAFKLYDTYGFPFELTEEILKEKGLSVSYDAFKQYMDKQRQQARQARQVSGKESWVGGDLKIEGVAGTVFLGYDQVKTFAQILKLYNADHEAVTSLEEGGFVVLDQTVLYAESGGQVGDHGLLIGQNGSATVNDVIKANNDIFLHQVTLQEGQVLNVGENVEVTLNTIDRNATQANHTATHLLHWALKTVLGAHVNQAGSQVDKDRLRFDYSHFEGPSKEQLKVIEEKVNEMIAQNIQTTVNYMTLDEAKNSGVIALFDAKYGEEVRVVAIPGVTSELCGGTHVTNTGHIGLFKIVSEGGIASGIRRIEALTSLKALHYLNQIEERFYQVAQLLKTTPEHIETRVDQLQKELKEKDKTIQAMKQASIEAEMSDLENQFTQINDIKAFILSLADADSDTLREVSDKIQDKYDDAVVVLASQNQDKALFIASVSKPLVKKGLHAGNIVKEVAKVAGGGGGGRPDFAQAGGKNPDQIEKALEKGLEVIKDMIK